MWLHLNIQLFRQRLSHKSVKAYATVPICIMSSKSLALLDWGSQCFSKKEGESMNTRVCAVSFYHAETPWASINREPSLPIIPFDIYATTFLETAVWPHAWHLIIIPKVNKVGYFTCHVSFIAFESIILEIPGEGHKVNPPSGSRKKTKLRLNRVDHHLFMTTVLYFLYNDAEFKVKQKLSGLFKPIHKRLSTRGINSFIF